MKSSTKRHRRYWALYLRARHWYTPEQLAGKTETEIGRMVEEMEKKR